MPPSFSFIFDAADIRDTDTVIEIGAGAGTVARRIPWCASLTLVELDERLISILRRNAPSYASVLNVDGIALSPTHPATRRRDHWESTWRRRARPHSPAPKSQLPSRRSRGWFCRNV
ncbi:rRNA adenine N-6-methyltransferase family protein [Pseudonocardia endophytica]|uniref:rRNA adenine N-6-methyltransferase family protein n=1 Tax=Pseudonocardia endophytica TaxID=401976 RepID=UPI00104629CD